MDETCWDRGANSYAFSRVVLRKVALQMLHWMSMAAAFCPSISPCHDDILDCGFRTAFSWDLAVPFASFALRSRFCWALAPYIRQSVRCFLRRVDLGVATYVTHGGYVAAEGVGRKYRKIEVCWGRFVVIERQGGITVKEEKLALAS